MTIIDIKGKEHEIKVYTQYESIPYSNEWKCDNCNKFNFICESDKFANTIKGYCETSTGYMVIVECPICFELSRFHCTTTERYDKDKFIEYLKLMLCFKKTVNI